MWLVDFFIIMVLVLAIVICVLLLRVINLTEKVHFLEEELKEEEDSYGETVM